MTITPRPTYPERLDIELTNACQLHCVMCPRGTGQMRRPIGFMDIGLLERIIAESRGRTMRVWAHVFGESTMHPDCALAVAMLSEAGFAVGLSTNGVGLDREMSEGLMRSGLDCLILSLDSLDRTKYESIRVGADHGAVLRNIDDCLDARGGMTGATTRILVQVIDLPGADAEVRAAEARYGARLEAVGGDVFHKWLSSYGGAIKLRGGDVPAGHRGVCEMVDNALTILWNGDATICCHDASGDYVLGNLRESGIEALWQSPELVDIHDSIRAGEYGGLEMCRACMAEYKGQG